MKIICSSAKLTDHLVIERLSAFIAVTLFYATLIIGSAAGVVGVGG